MTKKIALALAALIALAPAAHAGELYVGRGSMLCTQYLAIGAGLAPSPDIVPETVGWTDGYWAGLNASGGPQTGPWVGQVLGSIAILGAIWNECQRNPHQDLQSAETAVYNATRAAGK
jgi:MFS family permease